MANDTSIEPSDRTDDFFRLFAQSEGRVFAYILSLVSNWADAEEVFQETCAAMWRDFETFCEQGAGTPADFARWGSKIAFHRVLSFRRKNRRQPVSVSEEFLNSIARASEDRADDLQERMGALSACVERLSASDRELIAKRYGGEGTAKQAAELLGRPVDTVYKALKRIRGSLFDCIQRAFHAGERS